jgi:hypothetical protein
MAYYDYYCAANDRTVEVRHAMSETLRTWGDLCEHAGLPTGDTSADEPIERKVTAGIPLTGRAAESPREACGPSCACAWD